MAKNKKVEVREPRILLYDIETSLQTAAVFQPGGNEWIRPENLLTERHLISACWMWLGENTVHSVSLLDDPTRFAKDPHDDRYVVETLHGVLAEADCSVAHFGDSFDLRYLKTRALIHGLDPLPPTPTIDTKKIAKAQFYFNYNSLDYIGKTLGVGGKANHSSGLWLDILTGGTSEKAVNAIKKMVTYNKRDVTLLRDVFLKLRPHIPNHINRELFGNTGCPRCGSKKVQSRGVYYAQTRTYRRWQCQGQCKGWFRTLRSDEGSTTKSRVL
jgi:hypothetical protein